MNLSQETIKRLIELISSIMHALNEHDIKKIKNKITTLKKISNNFPLKLKNDIQEFIIQADIQKDYDIAHGVSKNLKQLADQICSDLKKIYI